MKKVLIIILIGIIALGIFIHKYNLNKKQAELVAPTQEAINLTVKELEYNEYVQDAGIGVHRDKGTIKIAIQTKLPVNEKIAKDLIDEGIKQLSSFNDGENGHPDKDYYGKLWETWNAEVVVFIGDGSKLILQGDKQAGKEPHITYHHIGSTAE